MMLFKRKKKTKQEILARFFWYDKKVKLTVKELSEDDISKIDTELQICWDGINTELVGYELGFIAGYCFRKE
jgi:uncharacterized protein YcfL